MNKGSWPERGERDKKRFSAELLKRDGAIRLCEEKLKNE